MYRFIIAALSMALIAFALMGNSCGQNDVQINSRDKTGAVVLNMPDHFSSIATKCDGHGHRVFIADHGDSANGGGGVAVINDPTCTHVGP